MATYKIIILDRRTKQGPNERVSYNYILWLDVPVARQPFFANPEAVSQWVNIDPADLTAIKNGEVYEKAESQSVAAGATAPQIMALLEDRWQKAQDNLNNHNLWDRYGTTWDGTTWTPNGVA